MTCSGTTPLCGYCGRPVIGMAVWDAGRAYHAECTRGPSWHQTYASIPSPHGQARALRQLSEDDVRRIVREEMAKMPNARCGLPRPKWSSNTAGRRPLRFFPN